MSPSPSQKTPKQKTKRTKRLRKMAVEGFMDNLGRQKDKKGRSNELEAEQKQGIARVKGLTLNPGERTCYQFKWVFYFLILEQEESEGFGVMGVVQMRIKITDPGHQTNGRHTPTSTDAKIIRKDRRGSLWKLWF